MQGKLEEIEKDLKFAQMLMKTYVDQIARENKKLMALEDTMSTDRQQTFETIGHIENIGSKKNSISISRRLTTINNSTIVTIRNNEGKVCNTNGPLKKSKTTIKRGKT